MQNNIGDNLFFEQWDQSDQNRQIEDFSEKNQAEYILQQQIPQQSQLDSIQQSSNYNQPHLNVLPYQQPPNITNQLNKIEKDNSGANRHNNIFSLEQNASFRATFNQVGIEERKQSQIIILGLQEMQQSYVIDRKTSVKYVDRQEKDKMFEQIHHDDKIIYSPTKHKNLAKPQSSMQQTNKTEDALKPIQQQHALDKLVSSPQRPYQQKNKKLAQINKYKNSHPPTSNLLINDSSMIKIKEQPSIVYNQKQQLHNGSHAKLSYQSKINRKLAEKIVPHLKTLKCILKRQKKCCINYYHPQFSLTLKDMTFLLNAKKQFGNINSHYNITSQEWNYNRSTPAIMGYLKGNFVGSQFNLFSITSDLKEELVCTIVYCNQSRLLNPIMRTEVYIKNQAYSYSQLYGYDKNQFKTLEELYPLGYNIFGKRITKLVTKAPTYNKKTDSYVLKFNKNNIWPSIHNLILVGQKQISKNVLLFCKMDRDSFCMQIGSPLSPLIAMGIMLSSFDFKIYCQ